MRTGEKVEVLFKCNMKRCDECSYPKCKHTSDFKYAKNKILIVNDDVWLDKNVFEKRGNCFFEK